MPDYKEMYLTMVRRRTAGAERRGGYQPPAGRRGTDCHGHFVPSQ